MEGSLANTAFSGLTPSMGFSWMTLRSGSVHWASPISIQVLAYRVGVITVLVTFCAPPFFIDCQLLRGSGFFSLSGLHLFIPLTCSAI
jgi:hypothetical protein